MSPIHLPVVVYMYWTPEVMWFSQIHIWKVKQNRFCVLRSESVLLSFSLIVPSLIRLFSWLKYHPCFYAMSLPQERPKSAVFTADVRSKMSVEEQNERIRRNRGNSARDKRRSLNLSGGQSQANYKVVWSPLGKHIGGFVSAGLLRSTAEL